MERGGVKGPEAPACPRNWYLAARSRELASGRIVAGEAGLCQFVLFRSRKTGATVALAAHCRHAGCHLGHGEVVDDGLRCALHHRVIDAEGAFLSSNGEETEAPRQKRLPVMEAFGCVFVFVGGGAPSTFYRPAIAEAGPIVTRALEPRYFDAPWSTLIANGMDVDHLQAVHDRAPRETPRLEQIGPGAIRLTYRNCVTGTRISDRIMKWLADNCIHGKVTCVGGSMLVVETRVGKRETFILLSMSPSSRGGSWVRCLVGAPGDAGALLPRMTVRFSAWLFQSFLKKDFGVLQQMKRRIPEMAITSGDSFMQQLEAFFCAQPEADETVASSGTPSVTLANEAFLVER